MGIAKLIEAKQPSARSVTPLRKGRERCSYSFAVAVPTVLNGVSRYREFSWLNTTSI